ncbi:MAG: DoxX family protein [Pseudomonadota bacterium]
MTDEKLAPYAALVLRVSLGTLFLAHAGLKLFVFTPAGTAAYFAGLGLPEVFGYATILVEAAAGVALILGFQVRAVSLATLPILLGSIVLVHGQYGWLFSNPGGGWEFPAFWMAAQVVQAMLGNGAYAIANLRRPVSKAVTA